MVRHPRLRSVLLGLGCALAAAACGDVLAGSRRPDVLLITVDTTRADRLGPFSTGGGAETPFLDELAARSVVFDNAWTGSTWTGPSMATIFTGLLPPRHGLVQNLWAQVGTGRDERKFLDYMADVELVAMPSSVPTIPEHLRAAGYQTVGVATNPNLCQEFGFTRGFDAYRQHSDLDADKAVDELLGLVGELDPSRPRFFFLHLNDPHVPYQSHQPWCSHEDGLQCGDPCRYRSELSFLDSQLRRLYAELELDDDAIVIFVNDHGEEFLDHGDIGHRYSMHAELARAALMVHAPGVAPRRTGLPSHQVDILPSLLQLLDLAPPETRDGIALIPSLEDESLRQRPLITHRVDRMHDRELWGLTLGRWRLMEELPEGLLALYDLSVDPTEQHDLSGEQPEMLAELRARLAELREVLQPLPRNRVRVDMTDQLTEDLIKLGYAGEEH